MSQQFPSRFHFPSPGFSKYWNEGRGRFLSKKVAGKLPSKEEIEQKTPWLFEVDELADRVIREVMIPLGYPKTMQLLGQALSEGHFENLSAHGDSSTRLNSGIPQILIDLVEFSLQKPVWLDLEKVEIGAKLCRRSGTRGFMVLRNYCLMGGYESSAINKPLIFTGALKKGAAKRTTETTEFWVKVVGERALENPHTGICECILIRLMHSYARVSILNGEGWFDDAHHKWRTDDWGEPLNQWDMIATNLGFSVVFLDGIRSLGVKVKPEEVEGLFHLWKYIGYLLGIPADLLPETEEQAIRELYAWTITQPPADADTQELAKALMLEPLSSNFPSKMWQKKRVIQLHLAYNYFFLGADSCRAMGLPVKGWSIFPFLLRNITRMQEIYYRTSAKAFENGVRKRRRNQEKVARLYLAGAQPKDGKHD